jgi:hypothetical protein
MSWEAIVVYFRLYLGIFLEGLRETEYLRLVGVLSDRRTRNYPNTATGVTVDTIWPMIVLQP